jgi:hypothetical protein
MGVPAKLQSRERGLERAHERVVRADADHHPTRPVRSWIDTHETRREESKWRATCSCATFVALEAEAVAARAIQDRNGASRSISHNLSALKGAVVNARQACRAALSVAAFVLAASCLNTSGPGTADTQIRIINASGQALGIYLDGRLEIDQSVQPNVSLIVVPGGDHVLDVRTSNGIDTSLPLVGPPGGFANFYAYTTDAGDVNLIQLDSTATPAGNSTKVRALNLSKIAAGDIYASISTTDPGTKLAPAFDYLSVTPYMEQTAGAWQVYLTTAGTTTKVLGTGLFPAPPGQTRTVVLIDSATTPIFRILPN